MKLVKMSLAAAVLLGASAFAIDNVKVSGDAKLYYGTNNMGDADLFSKGSAAGALTTGAGSYADTALRFSATADLAKGISAGVTGYAVSTLGLENNLVSNTWTGAHGATVNGASFGRVVGGVQVDDASWIGEAWIAATAGKTTVKLGRMELDTPLAFSEKWSVVPNTFEGAVVLNQDLPDTTLVGAWVGKGNGGSNDLSALVGAPSHLGIDNGVVGPKGNFNTFVKDGAYAAAIVNNSFKPATVQAWYYNVVDIADAYWLQADINCQLVKGLTIGAQYADMDTKGVLAAEKDSSAYAVKLGYAVDKLKVAAAYSSTDDEGYLKVANVATSANAQSKLYTEAYWNYGYVGAAGADAYMVSADFDAGVAKIGAQYTDVTVNPKGPNNTTDMTEVALTVSKSFGPLDATLAYVSTDADDQNIGTNGKSSRYDTVLAMLQLNF